MHSALFFLNSVHTQDLYAFKIFYKIKVLGLSFFVCHSFMHLVKNFKCHMVRSLVLPH